MIDCSTTPGVEFQPAVVCQPDGIIRLVWVAHRNQSWHLVSRVLHNGHLSDEQVIISHPDGLFHPRLAIGPDGECWLAFEKVEQQRPRLMVSQMRGDRWLPPTPIGTPGAACCRPSLAAGPDRGLWVAYDAYADGTYQVYIQRIDQPSDPVAVTQNEMKQ
jgi:hypothetical protein